jgi:hypothetical protein
VTGFQQEFGAFGNDKLASRQKIMQASSRQHRGAANNSLFAEQPSSEPGVVLRRSYGEPA